MTMRNYTTVSVGIGCLQILDAAILYHYDGVVVPPARALASVEFVWATVSLVMMVWSDQRSTRWLASAFFFYNVLGWSAGALLLDANTVPKLPLYFILIGGAFGVIFAASSLLAAALPGLLRSTLARPTLANYTGL